jgi:hypothetical protein
MLFESNPVSRYRVEVRRLYMGMAQRRQAVASPLIHGYEEYVH